MPVNTARLHHTLARIADAKPQLLLQRALPLSNSAFRITASHGVNRLNIDEDGYNDLVMAATKRVFGLVPDTLVFLADDISRQIVLSAIIQANTEVRDYSEQNLRGMRAVSANVFADDSDNSIWRVIGDGDNRALVQNMKEDFSALLAARLERRAEAVVTANYAGEVPANGDYVYYYNPEFYQTGFGFALTSSDNKLQVYDRERNAAFAITAGHIIEINDGEALPKEYSLVARMLEDAGRSRAVLADVIAPAAFTAYLDYMRTLFAGTDYFAELERQIKSSRKSGGTMTTIHD